MYQNFIIPHLQEAQHVLGDTTPIIRSLTLHWQPLVFYMWKVGGRCQRPATTRPTTFHVWKTGGCQCSVRLLMMGGVSPETCWASFKYEIIKFWYIVASCLNFFYELYYPRISSKSRHFTEGINLWCLPGTEKKLPLHTFWLIRKTNFRTLLTTTMKTNCLLECDGNVSGEFAISIISQDNKIIFAGESKGIYREAQQYSRFWKQYCEEMKSQSYIILLIFIYLLTAVGLTPGGSSTVHIYIKAIHRPTQFTTLVGRLSGIRSQSGQTKINPYPANVENIVSS